MRHGSLFSGIGGFDLAAEWMGWENVFHCEWMEFPRKVLEYHFPNADSLIDICKTDFKKYEGTIDIITGGFPCQPFSTAGKRKGTSDERYLWGEMLRAVQEIKPKYVIGENVFGITNIDGGMVFEQVCLDLETEGYEVQPFIIPAAAKNAPHRRDRCWFIGVRNATDSRCVNTRCEKESKRTSSDIAGCCGNENTRSKKSGNVSRNATDTNSNGLNKCNGNDEINTSEGWINAQCDVEQITMHTNSAMWEGQHIRQKRKGKFNGPDSRNGINNFQNFPTQSPICGGDDGLPTELDGITFSKWRGESIKGYGNAIVPQVAYEIFKAIEKL